MKLLRIIIPTLLAAALVLLIAGYANAADASDVPASSDLQERTLNEQINVKTNGIGGIMSPQHESKSGKSKSAKTKNGSNNVNVIDKAVAFAFRTAGILGLNNIINEEKSIDIYLY